MSNKVYRLCSPQHEHEIFGYCKTCSQFICEKCYESQHRGHIVDFIKFMARDEIENCGILENQLNELLLESNAALKMYTRRECIDQMQSTVKLFYETLIQSLRHSCNRKLEEVHEMLTPNLKNLERLNRSLQTNKDLVLALIGKIRRQSKLFENHIYTHKFKWFMEHQGRMSEISGHVVALMESTANIVQTMKTNHRHVNIKMEMGSWIEEVDQSITLPQHEFSEGLLTGSGGELERAEELEGSPQRVEGEGISPPRGLEKSSSPQYPRYPNSAHITRGTQNLDPSPPKKEGRGLKRRGKSQSMKGLEGISYSPLRTGHKEIYEARTISPKGSSWKLHQQWHQPIGMHNISSERKLDISREDLERHDTTNKSVVKRGVTSRNSNINRGREDVVYLRTPEKIRSGGSGSGSGGRSGGSGNIRNIHCNIRSNIRSKLGTPPGRYNANPVVNHANPPKTDPTAKETPHTPEELHSSRSHPPSNIEHRIFFLEPGSHQIQLYYPYTQQLTPLTLRLHSPIPDGFSSVEAPPNRIFISGGERKQLILNDLTELSEHTRKLLPRAPMNIPRRNHLLLSLGPSIYAFGGYNKGQGLLSHCEKYSLLKDFWIDIHPLNHERNFLSGCTFNQRMIYVFGGNLITITASTDIIEKYDSLKMGSWEKIVVSTKGGWTNRYGVGCIQVSQAEILVFGGLSENEYYEDFFYFNTQSSSMHKVRTKSLRLKEAFYMRQTVLCDEKIYAFGFWHKDVHIFDLKAQEWNFLQPLETDL